jgi:hypothetical protein
MYAAGMIFGSSGSGAVDSEGRQIIAGGTARKALVITAGADIAPTAGITASADTEATVIFAGDTVAVAVKLLGGLVYPYSIKKVTVGAGIVGLY